MVAGLEHRGDLRLAHTAPTGKPLPIALAIVTTSGTTPACWKPNHVPVRAKPVCTSSIISSRPRSSHSARTSRRYCGSAGTTPPSPCTGSSSTAATVGSMAASSAAMSLNGTCRKPSGIGWNGSCFAGWPVAASVASVRPWKLP